MNPVNETATFVVPHWSENMSYTCTFLNEAIESIMNQSDPDWQMIIIDDASPCLEAKPYLLDLQSKHPDRIAVVLNESNLGPGGCRNVGIAMAYERSSPFILFNDADDLSHSNRLQTVRTILQRNPGVDVVYTSFQVIDEHGGYVGKDKLTASIIEILDSHEDHPVQGPEAWIEMGTMTGYTNLTSATAVRTSLAYKYRFPDVRVSEDYYAWLLYSAGGGDYAYASGIHSKYRIPQQTGSATRARLKQYYAEKARVDEMGFLEALRIAGEKDECYSEPEIVNALLYKFYVRLSETLVKEREFHLANEQMLKAERCMINPGGSL
ncbi:glycosyl transferase family 2 [Fontibacillus phaseoli]|uniref:Glycosyl transferase family 2 n=1 Tax=Fontibacillus phaseoli TaxID=1416533 RepID=A0A369B744_9BACL|nr:glycosyltransferase family A protein [Fontibacillus phaseoli]RCX17333.1 glycosyl transferase family 2 [Fontibacillus phaseoli]